MTSTEEFSKQIRLTTLEMVHRAKASHIGGAFSMSDLLSVLYSEILNIFPNDPDHPQRDRFFLSKGHACTSLYATLALKNFFDKKLLDGYADNDSILLSHTSHKVPGVELSTGSLGHAFGVACGVALAGKRKKCSWRVYVLLSDGELDEGSNWEAFLFAPQHQLNNLTVIIDYNKIQSLGNVKEVIDLDPLKDKLIAFNWDVIEINGHDHSEIKNALKKNVDNSSKPKVIIANTIKGKGIDFMENKLLWHYKSPDQVELNEGIKQINSQ